MSEVKPFKIALAQYPIYQHASAQAWKASVISWIEEAVSQNAQVLVFPEYGSLEITSLFSKELLADLKGQISEIGKYLEDFKNLYSEQAQKHEVYILAPSLPIEMNGKFINRAYFFNPNGKMAYQDKLSMTRFEDEKWGISSGDPVLYVFNTAYGKMGISICFDSEFPQYAYELAQKEAHLLIVPSCTESQWGLSRVHIGSQARALENQMYVVTSSTVGDALWSEAVDRNTGQAAVFGPADLGFPADGVVARGELNKPSWIFEMIDLSKIKTVRSNGHVFNFKHANKVMMSNSKLKVVPVKF